MFQPRNNENARAAHLDKHPVIAFSRGLTLQASLGTSAPTDPSGKRVSFQKNTTPNHLQRQRTGLTEPSASGTLPGTLGFVNLHCVG